MVWGQELYFDATKVEANADVDSLVPRFYRAAKAHLADLFAAPDEARWRARCRPGMRLPAGIDPVAAGERTALSRPGRLAAAG